MALLTKKLAIDLGTKRVRVQIPKRGVVYDEPNIVAFDDSQKHLYALGTEAQDLLSGNRQDIVIIRPYEKGVIADFNATKQMLSAIVGQVAGRLLVRKTEAMVSVSATASSAERKALVDSLYSAGIHEVNLIQSATAAALGAGLSIDRPKGSMIVDIGYGTTEAGVYSLGGEVVAMSTRTGMSSIEEDTIRYLRRNHSMSPAQSEIRSIIHDFIDLEIKQEKMKTVHGKSIHQGLPKSSRIKHSALITQIDRSLNSIVKTVAKTLEKTPPDLVGDILKQGIVISGGGANIKGLESYMTKRLNNACLKAQNPTLCTVKGAFVALDYAKKYRRSMLS